MFFAKSSLFAALAASTVSAAAIDSLSSLLSPRTTDPSGTYPVCAASAQVVGKPFYLSVTPYGSDPAYGAGFVQETSDGQMFAGSDNGVSPTTQNCESATKPFYFFGSNGLLWDNHGRVVECANGQIQSNYGGGSTFSLCTATGQLTYNGVNTMYACQNGGTGSYRLYTGSQKPGDYNVNCNVVYLTASYL